MIDTAVVEGRGSFNKGTIVEIRWIGAIVLSITWKGLNTERKNEL